MKTRNVLALGALCLLVAAPAAWAGDVTGKIVYEGPVPKLRPVKMDADPSCAKKHDSPVYPDVLSLGDGNAMQYVFVQVKDAPEGGKADGTVVIDQVGCRYEPHVAGVMVGQALQFRNSDGILHNVHGLPEVNREFNIGMPPSLTEKDVTFNKPEPVFPVKCDVHPWMKAYVAVMTHPYFAVTGDDGTFTIKGLPAGDYEVEAWHERLGTRSAKVTVGASGSATADFSFSRPN